MFLCKSNSCWTQVASFLSASAALLPKPNFQQKKISSPERHAHQKRTQRLPLPFIIPQTIVHSALHLGEENGIVMFQSFWFEPSSTTETLKIANPVATSTVVGVGVGLRFCLNNLQPHQKQLIHLQINNNRIIATMEAQMLSTLLRNRNCKLCKITEQVFFISSTRTDSKVTSR